MASQFFLSIPQYARGWSLSDPLEIFGDLRNYNYYIIPSEEWLGHPIVLAMFHLRKFDGCK